MDLLRAERPGFDLPETGQRFSSSHQIQTGSGVHPATYPIGNWETFTWR